jgi:hypothetical protein
MKRNLKLMPEEKDVVEKEKELTEKATKEAVELAEKAEKEATKLAEKASKEAVDKVVEEER